MNARHHYQQLAADAERSIGDANAYERLISMERAEKTRRNVLEFMAGFAVGIVLLFVVMA